MAKLTLTVELTDTQQTILKNDLLDLDAWLQDPIPSNQADFVKLVTARSDYKDRAARDKASKIG